MSTEFMGESQYEPFLYATGEKKSAGQGSR